MKLTPEKLSAFCAALAETGQVSKACAAVGISRQTAYGWREDLPEFAEAWDKALKISTGVLEDEAVRRGHDGWDEPVFHQGVQCGTVRKFSDTMLIFTLKARDPAKYRENSRVELTGADGGPVQMDDKSASARLAQMMALAQARKDDSDDLVE